MSRLLLFLMLSSDTTDNENKHSTFLLLLTESRASAEIHSSPSIALLQEPRFKDQGALGDEVENPGRKSVVSRALNPSPLALANRKLPCD